MDIYTSQDLIKEMPGAETWTAKKKAEVVGYENEWRLAHARQLRQLRHSLFWSAIACVYLIALVPAIATGTSATAEIINFFAGAVSAFGHIASTIGQIAWPIIHPFL